MDTETTQIEPRWARTRPKEARTRIGNGAALLLADGRSTWSKRFREIVSGHVADLGGYEILSQAKLAIIRRCATLQIELEHQEARLASGDAKGFSLAEFAQVSNGLRRMLETIGLERVPKDATPDLSDILARHANTPAFIDAEREQARADEVLEEGRDSQADEAPESKNAEQAPVGDCDSNGAHVHHLPDAALSNVAHGRHMPDADADASNTKHVSNLPDSNDSERSE